MDITEETTDKLIKKKRSHILKKIKKHLGIVRREPQTCLPQNNLPHLHFHNVHGDNIRISRDGTQARRFESFCRAITFSARPVRINERIYMRFSEISNNWNGGIRFGFTSNDPASLENSLPKYACPDLTNRPGFWAKALHEQHCELNNVLHYYVNSTGDVMYGINGEEKGIILSGIDIRGLLWTVIDIYGNCTAIELLDARLFNQQSSTVAFSSQVSHSNNLANSIVTPMQSLSILDGDSPLPHLKYNINRRLVPLPFHTAKGRNVRLSPDHVIAARTENDFCQGYVFTSRPIQTEESIVVQILKTDHTYVGALALGLTSCNPASLNHNDLPVDSNFLLDRPEYWVVNKDIALPCNKGDEISVSVSAIGEVTISKNCGTPAVIMHVDHRLQLWAFFDVYGSTRSIRVFQQYFQSDQKLKHSSSSVIHPISSSNSTASINVGGLLHQSNMLCSMEASLNSASNISMPKVSQIFLPSSSDMIQLQPGGTVLVVNLPQVTNRTQEFDYSNEDVKILSQATSTYSNNPNVSTNKNQSFEPNLNLGSKNNDTISKKILEDKKNDSELTASECTICYEKKIDSVLYMCGHMCMCYECAIEQWRGAGCGQCPLCRAVIRDVIRTYTT
ncbi:protein neuralized [Eupeodes corollae]|uniref:protein neuralized n=1 Tax=Eupeodes corollae TaxID=290404 RepID=UPI00248FC38D|nr:protein neuralized [Eupeodes corollae]